MAVSLVAVIWTHAILATLSWALFFPLGAIVVRVITKNARNIHWMVQVLGVLCFTVAFGLGAWIATTLKLWVTWNGHAILGTVIFGLMLTMPILGILHHKQYISTKKSYTYAWIHVWLGRILILAGIINGGLGLQLGYAKVHMESQRKGEIAYGVCAGFIALVWIAISILACIRSKGDVNVGGESGQKVQGLAHLRNNSQDTAVGDNADLEKKSHESPNGTQPALVNPVAPAPTTIVTAPHEGAIGTAQGHTTTTTTTTTTTNHAGDALRGGEDIVHGGPHDQTRLADIIDPAVHKSEKTTMFGS